MIKFSIIIPVYNCQKKISIIAQQILNQDYKNLELILINDGSTDNSLDTILSLAKTDSRVIIIDQKNSGPSAARNAGIKKASGHFIIFCDSDDQINPYNFSKMLKQCKKSTFDMEIFGWEIVQKNQQDQTIARRQLYQKPQTITGNQQIIIKSLKSIGQDGRMYNLWNKIYRADIIKNNNLLLDEKLRFGEDLTFNFNFLKHATKINFSSLDPIYIYEEDSPTSIVSGTKLNFDFRLKNQKALLEFSDLITETNEVISYLNFVQWRWLISYAMAICGSNLHFKQKINQLHQAFINLKPAHNNLDFLSKKQKIIIAIAKIITTSKIISWLFFSLVNHLKKHRRAKNLSIELDLI